jgi:hypothetical protein
LSDTEISTRPTWTSSLAIGAKATVPCAIGPDSTDR